MRIAFLFFGIAGSLFFLACGSDVSNVSFGPNEDGDVVDGDREDEQELPPDYTQMPARVPLIGDGDRNASILVNLNTLEIDVQPGKIEGAAVVASCFGNDTSNPTAHKYDTTAIAQFQQPWQWILFYPVRCETGIPGNVPKSNGKDDSFSWVCKDGICLCHSYLGIRYFHDAQDDAEDWVASLTIGIGIDCDQNMLLLNKLKMRPQNHPAFQDEE